MTSIEAPRVRSQEEGRLRGQKQDTKRHLESVARSFAVGDEWRKHLTERLGTARWLIATQLTDSMKRQGFERAVSTKEFEAIQLDFGMPRLRKALEAYPN